MLKGHEDKHHSGLGTILPKPWPLGAALVLCGALQDSLSLCCQAAVGHFSCSAKGRRQQGGKPEVGLLLMRAQVLSLEGQPLLALCMLLLQ